MTVSEVDAMEPGMDVVLLQLPVWAIGCPPLGLASLKSYLAEHEISCRIFDINAHAYSISGPKYIDFWDMKHGYDYSASHDRMLEFYQDNRTLFLYYISEIKRLRPAAVGCSCFSGSFWLTQIFLEELRHFFPHCNHILGGPEMVVYRKRMQELLAKDFVDAICFDEGENSLVGYIRNIKNGTGEKVPGIVYKHNGSIIDGGPCIAIKNLDELPFPDFSDFNLRHYRSSNVLPSYTTRGCINQCIYCTARHYMKPYRFRSAERIFDEIKDMKEKYPEMDYIRLSDNISNGNIKELDRFCDLMIEGNPGVKWDLENAVLRKEMRAPLYKKLKKAGCTLVGYGLETPSHHLLKKIGKRLSQDVDFTKVLREGKRAGLYISVNIMFGLPGETDEDFEYLLDWVRKNRRAFNMVNPALTFCEFYPGCSVYEEPEKYNVDLSKGSLFWETYDRTNTYPVRMQRFERFCSMARKHGLDNLFNVEELPNKNELLFRYYFTSNEYDTALEYYNKLTPRQIVPEIAQMHGIIRGQKDSVAQPQHGGKKLTDILSYGTDLEDTFLTSSLGWTIEQLENEKMLEVYGNKKWKRFIRSWTYRIGNKLFGYDRIQKRIDKTYAIMKILDAKMRMYKRHDG